jgi:hypothetical protein
VLYLGTGYDSPAYHIYTGFGFRSVEPGSDYMAYCAHGDAAAFERGWFAAGPLAVEPLAWRHYPLLQPLFLVHGPRIVRSAGMHIIGRAIAEGGPLLLMQENEARAASGEPPVAAVLVNTDTAAVLGLASAIAHPLWLGKTLVDLYCHTHAWSAAPSLLDALALSADADLVAYSEADAPALTHLSAFGFRRMALLPHWLYASASKDREVDVVAYRRAGL